MMILQTALSEFLKSRSRMDLSPKTIDNYRLFIQPFVDMFGCKCECNTLTQASINQYIDYVVSRNITKASKATYIRHIKVFLHWIAKNEAVVYDYSQIKVPKSNKRVVRIYSPEDISMIFDTLGTADWVAVRNKACIALMYDSGLRLSEVCTLKHKNINYRTNRMIVRGKGDKERTVPIGRLTKMYLLDYMQQCPYKLDCVFVSRYGKPLTTNALKIMFYRLADALPFDLSAHKLRHNFATNYCIDQYYQRGQIDIYLLMYLLGHEDIETTRRYLHFAYEEIASTSAISHLDSLY